MKVLITAGGTFIPIDYVRGIDNIFNGRTGCEIAKHLVINNEDVTLLIRKDSIFCSMFDKFIRDYELMSDKKLIKNEEDGTYSSTNNKLIYFKTYDELYRRMEEEITTGNYDVIIHSAAVSDYKVDSVYFDDPLSQELDLIEIDKDCKISSNHHELYIKLTKTEKIVDKIRHPWNFKGILIKFKLELGLTDYKLTEIARRSKEQSGANIMVANCLEWSQDRAIVIAPECGTLSVPRDMLPPFLYGEINKINPEDI